MKPPRNQKGVMAALDTLNGRAMGRLARRHHDDIEEPIREVIGAAKSNKDLLRRLGKSLFRRMDSTALETAIADGQVQAGLIGRTTAMPGGKTKARHEGTRRHAEGDD